MVHPLALESLIAARSTADGLHTTHLVVHQVGVVLYGRHVGYLLLATIVVAADAKGVGPCGIGHRGCDAIVE